MTQVHEQGGLLYDLDGSTSASFRVILVLHFAAHFLFCSIMAGCAQVEIELHRRRQLGIIKEDHLWIAAYV